MGGTKKEFKCERHPDCNIILDPEKGVIPKIWAAISRRVKWNIFMWMIGGMAVALAASYGFTENRTTELRRDMATKEQVRDLRTQYDKDMDRMFQIFGEKREKQ